MQILDLNLMDQPVGIFLAEITGFPAQHSGGSNGSTKNQRLLKGFPPVQLHIQFSHKSAIK